MELKVKSTNLQSNIEGAINYLTEVIMKSIGQMVKEKHLHPPLMIVFAFDSTV
jgi:hypothetical protein